ncbi:MAG TPA: amidohydrolase [Marinilabiliales bacterium]|nr:MAG: amidohydrolase [Bacteroidetes bacterium GWC2_40_13]OFX75103.1 MAG: amidohydrolase [Bacteroidetes bacterium GWD2_40_43]OFX93848.1 MAG: amidohydrolase [Bacteroidetes bacterium GWE2_40_63]OFY18079.1 MAG: amidohydrolase [Bacteroidetes bacterium GWF2_40_13]OFZ27309.1 MAG: amidohydrolase [Bacteroidetes bacterium RIFOXYC2_FULL_40_12]HAM98989.1 amidohydrolase [Marinilabiliales bacterium]
MNRIFTWLLILGGLTMTSCKFKQKADLIIKNAKIYTVDKNFTVVQGIAVLDGRFVAVGPDATINAQYYSDQVLDLKGKYIYPGFIDPHCHFYGYGLTLTQVDLRGALSFTEVVERTKKHHQEFPMAWIIGRGWDQNLWGTRDFPTNELLNQAFPDVPVLLRRIDGHAAIANQKALMLAGINTTTKIKGGKILAENGKPTGLLTDKAVDKVLEFMPKADLPTQTTGLLKAQQNCFAVGLTSVGDAGLEYEEIQLIDSLQKKNQLLMRIYAMIAPSKENIENYLKKGFYQTANLTIRSLKLYADGALGSRGACLLEPYTDDPTNYGLLLESPDSLTSLCELAYEYNYQVNTHCVGDSANRLMLQIYGSVLNGKNDYRWRIEHAQVVNPNDLKHYKQFSVIPSVQTTHCTSDMGWAPERLGPGRIQHAYIWQDLLKQNEWLINGSDFPIEDINPLLGYYSAITRQDLNGIPNGGFYPKQQLSRMQALKAMTIWAAKGQFEEKEKGSIEKGKLADFVVLSQDLLSVPVQEIPNIKVEQTYSNGKLVFDVTRD